MIPDEIMVISKSYKDEGLVKITANINQEEEDYWMNVIELKRQEPGIATSENTPPDDLQKDPDSDIPEILPLKKIGVPLGEIDEEVYFRLD